MKHGTGEEFYMDGSKFKGQFVRGRKMGFGEMIYKDGTFFRGNWLDEKL